MEPAVVAVLCACDQLIKARQQDAIATLQTAIAAHPTDRDLRLLLLQTLIDQRDFPAALEACAALPSVLLHTPALQSLFFVLCQHVQDSALVDRLLKQFQEPADLPADRQVSLHRALAEYFFEAQQFELATDHLHHLLEQASLDAAQRVELTSRLTLATAHSNKAEAIRLGNQLPEVGIVEDVDMDELEDMLRRRDFLKRSGTTPAAAAALSQPSSPVPMEVEETVGQPQVEAVVENARKMVSDHSDYKEILIWNY